MAQNCILSAACEYPSYSLTSAEAGSVHINALVDLRMPSPSAPRPVFELALLLDISGSMSGPRLQSLQNAVLALLDHLDARDVVHLVTYSGTPTVVGSSLLVGPNRETLKRAVANLHASGSTNISDALERAACCIQRGERQLLRRIFLYSDGEPTSGLTDAEQFAALCRDLKASSGAEISTFGIGEGIDARILQEIAEVTGGRYEFVTQKRIVELTERAFTSMDRLFGLNGAITLTVPHGVRLMSAGEETATASSTLGIQSIALGNLKYDAPKQCLLEFSVAPGCAGGKVLVTLSYTPALDPLGAMCKQETVLDVSLLPAQQVFAAERPRNASVALAVALKAVGDAFTHAAAALECRDTTRARTLISEAIAELEQFKDLDTTGMAETQLRRGQRLLDRLRVQGAAGARRVELELGHQATMLQRCLSVDDFSDSCSDNHSDLDSPRAGSPSPPNHQRCHSGSSSPSSGSPVTRPLRRALSDLDDEPLIPVDSN